MLNTQQISKIKTMFSNADGLLITAGAGMSIDSGLPDFRGKQGMWQAYPELGKQRIEFTSIANPNTFWKTPRLAWGFYGHRLKLYRDTTPHQGFHLLKKMSDVLQLPYFIFTSNVDGQFQKVGFDENLIYECHGSIHHLQCLDVCENKIWSADQIQPRIDHIRCEWLDELPQCPHCLSLARPNILMFDDYDWLSHRTDQQRQNLEQWLKHHHQPIVIELGAGTAIPTVRNFSERFAPSLIRINPREYQLAENQGISIPHNALHSIQAILEALQIR
ncbi:Sir2 family NAD-dependent protein deacetylase [Acinetobacter sp. P8-3-8]|uniref:SIR2 family NAD-dependent protein deacylase n=1 Tax=Acinetobacter sp. P8-3-8 TaxID=1029823 RepID=UPI0002486558|nr:Sir2 family NAD-dependent protein deacetylase [Acinetobacter sp. P8-3-8]